MARTEDTQERLISAASELFFSRGYAATGVLEIQRRAGATTGSFYHFFPSKEDLLLAVLDRTEDLLRTRILAPLEEENPQPLRRIFSLFDWCRSFLAEHHYQYGSPIGTIAAELGQSSPVVREKLISLMQVLTRTIQGWLDEAADRLPSEIDRQALANQMMSVLEGAILQARISRSPAPFDAAAAHLEHYLRPLEMPQQRHASVPDSRGQNTPKTPISPDWRSW